MSYYDREDDDDDSGIKFYGTPFPPLKEDEAPSKKPDIDLTVRDEQGRRRFHGAFTGGFSAGYWNTVGSKEGWVPAQFVSSRKEKWDKDLVRGKPEDFMDEEDFMVHGIAPKSVHTKDLFSSDPMSDFVRPSASTTRQGTGESDLVDFLKQTVRPVRMSIGVQILKKMKGCSKSLMESKDKAEAVAATAASCIPKKNKEKKSLPVDQTSGSTRRLYGCTLPPEFAHFDDGSSSSDGDEEVGQAEPHQTEQDKNEDMENSFASYKLPFERKCNCHGLGYRGMLQPSAASSSMPSTSSSSMALSAHVAGKKLHITGDAFGIGVLDDENDDFGDVTLYEKEDMSKYDFEMRGERKKKNKSLRPALTDYGNRSLDELFVRESSRTSSVSKFTSLSKKYPPPEIPSGWRPAVRFPSSHRAKDRTASDPRDGHKDDVRSHDPDDECGKRRKKSRWDVRAGEEDEYKKSSSSSLSSFESPAGHSSASRSMTGRVMDANVRSLLLGEGIKVGVHRQFVTEDREEEKDKKRGKVLLEQKDKNDAHVPAAASSVTSALNQAESERRSTPTSHQRTPLFGFFANKFTHSSSSSSHAADAVLQLEAGLTRPSDIKCRDGNEKSDDASGTRGGSQQEASLIGTSDRMSLPWIPSPLLCKRFNVPQPGGSKNY